MKKTTVNLKLAVVRFVFEESAEIYHSFHQGSLRSSPRV